MFFLPWLLSTVYRVSSTDVNITQESVQIIPRVVVTGSACRSGCMAVMLGSELILWLHGLSLSSHLSQTTHRDIDWTINMTRVDGIASLGITCIFVGHSRQNTHGILMTCDMHTTYEPTTGNAATSSPSNSDQQTNNVTRRNPSHCNKVGMKGYLMNQAVGIPECARANNLDWSPLIMIVCRK